MKKYFLSLLIIFTFLIIPTVFASTNSGFIEGQIWFSEEPLIEGETVNIHTGVWNGEKNSMSVKVEFYDKNIILGSREVVLSTLELKDVYIPWKITSGDHIISAKITSSTVTVSGKKKEVVLDNIITSNSKKSVSTLAKDGTVNPLIDTDKLKSKLEDTSSKITDLLPEKVGDSVSGGINKLENFREVNEIRVSVAKENAKEEIDIIKKAEKPILEKVTEKVKIEEAVKKPIAYIKLFLFSILDFILSNSIVFYGFLILVTFYILRSIYRRIRNR